MSDNQNSVSDLLEDNQYKYGFTTDVESETFAKGLNEEGVRAISKKKNEPEFMLNFRLKAFQKWKTMQDPAWPNVNYPPIDFQDISYYSAPKKKKQLQSLDEVDPEVMRTFKKLGIPLDEQKKLANVAVDAVFDSVWKYISNGGASKIIQNASLVSFNFVGFIPDFFHMEDNSRFA